MTTHYRHLLPLLFLIISCGSKAGDETTDHELISKIAKREGTTVEEVKKSLEEGCSSGVTPYMRQCAYLNAVGEDIKLNETYQKLLRSLETPAAKQKLIKAQRAWLSFRDATCEYEAIAWTGGTGYGVVHSGCLAIMTSRRNQDLQSYASCDGSGCPR